MAESERHREAREWAEERLVSAVLATKTHEKNNNSDGYAFARATAERWAPVVLALNASTEVDDEVT